MKPIRWRLHGLMLTIVLTGVAWSQSQEQEEKQLSPPANNSAAIQEVQTSSPPSLAEQERPNTGVAGELKYVPPPASIRAPVPRMAGSSRGADTYEVELVAFAPDHVGWTIHDQPVLYWRLSRTTLVPIVFTLIEEQNPEPMVNDHPVAVTAPGVQQIRLADYGVRLTQGARYRWSIAIRPDSEHRAKDTLVTGVIECVVVPETLRARLMQAGKADALRLYASNGLWYDAFRAVSDLLEASPHDPALQQQRKTLLSSVGLSEAD